MLGSGQGAGHRYGEGPFGVGDRAEHVHMPSCASSALAMLA